MGEEAKNRTAIILMGSGMRSAHGAGFLYALAKNLGITSPNIMIGSSGDAGNVLYFASGQYESLKHIWTELLSTPKFISYWRFWKMMNVDYVIDTVFKKIDPLNIEALKKYSVEWTIPITNVDTGKTRYVTAVDALDPFETLRAAKALPVFFGKRISLSGGKYLDGEFGPTLEDHIHHAIERGAKRILLIDHGGSQNLLSKLSTRLYATTLPPMLRQAIVRDISTKSVCVTVPDASIVCLMPEKLPAGLATRNKKKLRETFEHGVADALALESELRSLFNTPAV